MGQKNVDFTKQVLKQNGLGFFGDELDEGPNYTWLATSSLPEPVAFLGVHYTYHKPDLVKLAAALSAAEAQAKNVVEVSGIEPDSAEFYGFGPSFCKGALERFIRQQWPDRMPLPELSVETVHPHKKIVSSR